MDMKKLIESMDYIGKEAEIDEGPIGMAPPAMAPEMDKGNPVTVNVSMNASGKEHVADLLDMMKNAGLGGAEEVGPKMLSPRMDMERLSAMMDEPDMEADEGPTTDDSEEDDSEEDDIEEYANEPDPQYGDMSDAIPDGNDLNRKKKAYAATQDGDNPMAVEAIKATLLKALAEKKGSAGIDAMKKAGNAKADAEAKERSKKKTDEAAKPDFLDMDKDGDTEEPMKKAIKDKKKKVKKGTDESGQTKDCPKCGAPGKKKLMACSSCGCS